MKFINKYSAVLDTLFILAIVGMVVFLLSKIQLADREVVELDVKPKANQEQYIFKALNSNQICG